MSSERVPEFDLPAYPYLEEQAQYQQRAAKFQDKVDGAIDPEHFVRVNAPKNIMKIDKSCPYIDQSVLVSGRAIINNVSDEYGIEIEVKEDGDELWGVHRGVVLVLDETRPPEKWRVMQLIGLTPLEERDEDGEMQIRPRWAHVDMDADIVPCLEVESAFTDYAKPEIVPIGERLHAAVEFSLGIRELLRSAEFSKLSRKKQQHLLAERVEQADSATQLRDVLVKTRTKHALVMGRDSKDEPYLDRFKVNGNIKGLLLGLVCIETLLEPQARIRSTSDLVLKRAGLCLVIDPVEKFRDDFKLEPHQVVYVPLGGARKLVEPNR